MIETYENPESKQLDVVVEEYDEHLTRISYSDPQYCRWQVPYYEENTNPRENATRYVRIERGFKLVEGVNNSFQWNYVYSNFRTNPIITTKDCRLQYFDKYLEFQALVDTDYIYGMGERIE